LAGVTLPATIGGSLYLSGCDLAGVTLPATIGGSLYLSGATNQDSTQWWQEHGETTKRRCIAVCTKDGYALIQTDTDRFFAGCRSNFTRKQALAHWGKRTDARAQLFIAAIAASELPA
ncbi:MAG: hypothetical protein KGM49_09380, partial [Sphingomonadales bacterium]|nr:hypothetical protein [Sphingomonadales bacterium]